MKALLSPLIGRLLILLRDVAPYAAIELLLPGGTVVALLYWWYRHRLRRARDNPQSGAQTESVSAELSTRPWYPRHRFFNGLPTMVLVPQALRRTAVPKSTTSSIATTIVAVLVCLSTACTTVLPVAADVGGEQVRRQVKEGDTVRVRTRAGVSHSFQVTAVGESSLSGNAVKLSGGGSDAVGARIDVPYLEIAQIEVRRLSGLKTTGVIAAVVLGVLIGTVTGWGSHAPGFRR